MPELSDLRAEIVALKAALVPSPGTASAEDAAPASEVARVLRELQHQLAEAASAAEEGIAAHPLAGVAASFLLGFALGRASKGR